MTLLKDLHLLLKKKNNELQNIFLHDKGNNLRNLSSNASDTFETTIISENGIIDEKNDFIQWSNNFI